MLCSMDDLIYIDYPFHNALTTDTGSVKIGKKRMRITVELDDSEDEFDNWFLESIPEKLGLHPRSLWMHPMNKRRETDGEYASVCVPLREYPDKFFKYYRMSVSTHDYIMNHIRNDITKHSIRPSISAEERFAVTIRYLSTGMSFQALAQSFMMDDYTVGNIVHEVCQKVYERLKAKHMAVPSHEDFKKIATEYEELWHFPHCIGAIDGKHIRIKRPSQSGSMFFNYKLFYSIVLQAVADARYRFIFIDVGAYGKQSDGGIFAASSLSKFINDKNNFPADPVVEVLGVRLPYLFVCDDAYPLKNNMMKPFSGSGLNSKQDIFNGRLSRARRCVECAFGILVNKWRLLLKAIETKKEYSPENIVKCTTILHNVIIDKEGINDITIKSLKNKIDSFESQNQSLEGGRRYNHSSSSAVVIRNCWMKYFNSSVGSVPWQDRYIKK